MMALGHAVTGAAAGLYATSLLQDHQPGPLLVGALVCAGGALVPDLDHPHSTAARTFGPLSGALSRSVVSASRAVHERTRSRRDRPDLDGHRTLTHTLAFAVFVALVAWVLASLHPVLVLLPLACAAVRALMPNLHLRRSGRHSRGRRSLRSAPVVLTVGAGVTFAAFDHIPCALGTLWLGGTAGLGCLVHYLGDAVTEQGCPILWPVPIAGRRWYPIGPPHFLRFKAGGKIETLIVVPVVILVTLVFAGSLVLPRALVDLLSV